MSPEPELPQTRLSAKTTVAFADEGKVNAEMSEVFELIFDLDKRASWMDGVRGIEVVSGGKINHVGTEHRCLVNPKHNPILVTESADVGSQRIELIEMDRTGMGGCRFRLFRENHGLTRVEVEVLVSNKFFVKLMFGLFMKGKYRKSIRKSLENLKACFTVPVKNQTDLVPA